MHQESKVQCQVGSRLLSFCSNKGSRGAAAAQPPLPAVHAPSLVLRGRALACLALLKGGGGGGSFSLLTLLFEAAETLQLLLLFGAVHAASGVTAAPQSRRTAPGNRSSPSPDGVRQAPVLPGGGGGRRPPGQIPGAGVTAPSAHARPSSRDASSEHVRKTRRRQPRVRPKAKPGFSSRPAFRCGW